MLLLLYDRTGDPGDSLVHALEINPGVNVRARFHEFLGLLVSLGRDEDWLPVDEFGDWLISEGYATDRFGDMGETWGFMEFRGEDTVADALGSVPLWLED